MAASVAVALCGAGRAGAAPAPDKNLAIFQREDSLVSTGHWERSQALLESLLVAARARGDRHLELQALVQRGGQLSFRGRVDAGAKDLRAAIRLAPQLRDTTLWLAALRALTFSFQNAGRLLDAAPLARESIRLARAHRDPKTIARAEIAVAFQQLCEGHFARAIPLYRRAVRDLAASGAAAEALEARVGLARSFNALGDDDAARNEYQGVIAASAGLRRWLSTANAWNNLGNIELEDGDPSTAVADWDRALPLYEQVGKRDFALSTRLNVARALERLGRHEEAALAVSEVIRLATADSGFDHAARGRIELAEIRIAEGRGDEGWALADSALHVGGPLTPETRAAAELAQVSARVAAGRLAEALAQVMGIRARAGGGLTVAQLRQIRRNTIDLELRCGRPREALRLLQAGADSSADAWHDHLLASRCATALGEPAHALGELERAAAGWERWRGAPGDPEWRESRGPEARQLYEAFHVLLASSPPGQRVAAERRAFDALQVFKARTLEERIGGSVPARRAQSRATLAWLQGGGLREGELFVDLYAGPDSAFACAVSRHACRWLSLGSARALLARADVAGRLFAAHGASEDALPACDEAASALGASVLGGCADLVAQARRVIISADGGLAGLPFGGLRLSGRALLEDREVVLVPSATVLRGLRTSKGGRASGAVLVIGGGAAPGGTSLAGAAREVRWLEQHVDGVRVVARDVARAALLRQLATCGAVHVAAHTEVNLEAPWRSGILLGSAGDAPEELDYLRASTIAQLRLEARLAVLSGCQSYGSRELFGEGVLGLSTAFLGAGVPAVLCTLWPVDDQATASFMEDFYARLLAGASPAAALRAAQLAARARPGTRHPVFWAGFVLVGDPDARNALRRHA